MHSYLTEKAGKGLQFQLLGGEGIRSEGQEDTQEFQGHPGMLEWRQGEEKETRNLEDGQEASKVTLLTGEVGD